MRPSPSRTWTAAACRARAARCSAARRRSTAWSISAATRSTSTAGRRKGPAAGPTRTACPISAAPRRAEGARRVPRQQRAALHHATAGCRTRSTAPSSTPARGRATPDTEDVNGYRQEGFGPMDRTTVRGRRWSAAIAYLRPARGRANLRVEARCLATRVLFEGTRATGVAYAQRRRRRRARARREVIVAGGAINSPQLLKLSGIGDADALQALGIAPVAARSRRGREPAGSPRDVLPARVHAADHAVLDAESRRHGAHRARAGCCCARASAPPITSRPAASSAARPGIGIPTSSTTSCRSRSPTTARSR